VAGNITNNSCLVFNQAGSLTFGNIISGAGSVRIMGGTVILGGANSYTGPTIISQGTLALGPAGSISASPSIAIASGASFDVSARAGGFAVWPAQTLTGSGSVTGNVRVNGTLDPGPGICSLVFNGDLTLSGTTLIELSKANGALTNDWVGVRGSLALGGSLVATLIGEPLSAGDVFPIFGATAIQAGFSTLSLPPLNTGLRWVASRLAVDGTLLVAPLPVPPVVSVGVIGTNLEISLQTDLGVTYVVETASELTLPVVWTPIATNSGTGGPLTLTIPVDPAQPRRYVRVVGSW
jgi:autotransporter-associated beta strand protein